MPLALLAASWLLLMTGINGNYAEVGAQFETDVLNNGQGGGFLAFMAGLVSISVFFRVIGLPNAGRVFLILVLVVFLLQNENVLTALQNIGGQVAQAPATTTFGAATGTSVTTSAGALANALVSIGQGPVTASQAGGNTGEASGTGSST